MHEDHFRSRLKFAIPNILTFIKVISYYDEQDNKLTHYFFLYFI